MKQVFALLISCVFLLALSACDKLCSYSVNDQASIENRTGSSLSLSACKNIGQRIQIEIPATGVNVVSLGQSQQSTVQGGMDAMSKCRAQDGETQSATFALTAESFAQVKLCFSTTTSENIIVNRWSACPLGFQAQTSQASCN